MASQTAQGGFLNGFFHYKERGAKLSDEIIAGLGVCALAVCGMFINMQLIANLSVTAYAESSQAQVAANGEVYAQIWFVSMIVAFVGTMAIGLVARLPLVQTTSLGLSSVLVSIIGSTSGLTYYNVLVLSFFSAIVYTVLVSVPPIKKFLFQAIPAPVRKALPAAAGLLIAYVALQLSGLITVSASSISIYGTGAVMESASDSVSLSSLISWSEFSYSTDRYYPTLLINAVAMILAVVVFLVAKRRTRHPFTWALVCGTVVFLVASILLVCVNWSRLSFSIDSLWARLWIVGAEDAMQFHLSAVLSSLSIGAIFSEGLDFSAYTEAGGNVVLLAVGCVLTFTVMNLSDALSTMDAVRASSKSFEEGSKEEQLALVCNAGMNIVAPIVGASPVSVSAESYAGAEDRARSGLSSCIAALGFLVSAFVMVLPFFFITVVSYDVNWNMVGHYGFCLQLLCEVAFSVADMVMVLVGLNMATRSLDLDWKKFSDVSAVLGTVAGTFFTSNIAVGLAVGTLAYVLAEGSRKGKALAKMGEEPNAIKRLGVPTLVLAVLSIVVLGFALYL